MFLQIIRDMFGKQNVTAIAAIHYPLGHVNPTTGDVGAAADISYLAHRPAMNSHPNGNVGMGLKRLCNLERALRRFLCAIAKDQRHPIAGRQPNELFVSRVAHLRCPEHDRCQLAEALLLFLEQELRVTDNVDEENMPDLEANIFVRFRHGFFLTEAILCGDVFLRRQRGNHLSLCFASMLSSAPFRSQPFRTARAAAAPSSAPPTPRTLASHRASAASRNIGVTQQILTESGNPTPISFASNSFASQDMLTDPYSASPLLKA